MKNRIGHYIFSVLLFICGTGMGIEFFTWGLEEIEKEATASSIVMCFSASAAFFALGCFGFMLFGFGRGAYLRIEDGRVRAHYGMNRELDVALEAIEDVAVFGRTVHIFCANTVHSVSAPTEKSDLLRLIECGKKPWEIDERAERTAFDKAKKAHVVAMTAVCILLLMLVLNVVLCSQLTGGNAPSEFTREEDSLWLAFFFAAVLTVAAAFFAANRAGKLTLEKERRIRRIAAYMGYMHRYDGIEPANAVRTVLFDSYRLRVTVKYIYESYVYDMEIIDSMSGEWVLADSGSYSSREEAMEAVDTKLGDAPINEDKLFD
ncbi:MAG: hypothetical protein IJF74_04920 [Clostridia bacterium]|nr:hypothetical protein [Clostridia bacterium]